MMRETIINRITYYINRIYYDIWREKINRVLVEYHNKIIILDGGALDFYASKYQVAGTIFNYRSLNRLECYSDIWSLNHRRMGVAKLVKNY